MRHSDGSNPKKFCVVTFIAKLCHVQEKYDFSDITVTAAFTSERKFFGIEQFIFLI